jgi:hypothetical protein
MNVLRKPQPISMGPLVPPFADVTETSLDVPEDLAQEQWLEIGQALGRGRSASMWWIGDWWAFGEHHYGARKGAVETEGWEGPAFQTCVHAATVCRAFTTRRRRPLLSFTAHQEVAVLKEEEHQDQILDEAITHGWTTRQIRDAVKHLKASLAQDWTPDQLARKARAEAGECVVANMRDDGTGKRVDEALLCWAELEDRFVRIDRASKWGNPFEMPDDGERPEVIGKFTKFYLPYKPGLLRRMHTLGGKVVGCWCHPEECHGHVIAEIVNRGLKGEEAESVIDELARADG